MSGQFARTSTNYSRALKVTGHNLRCLQCLAWLASWIWTWDLMVKSLITFSCPLWQSLGLSKEGCEFCILVGCWLVIFVVCCCFCKLVQNYIEVRCAIPSFCFSWLSLILCMCYSIFLVPRDFHWFYVESSYILQVYWFYALNIGVKCFSWRDAWVEEVIGFRVLTGLKGMHLFGFY